MTMNQDIGAVVLCGGKSSRMGRPKHLLPFGNQVVLQRIVQTLENVTDQIVIVAAQGQELPALPGSCQVVRDEEEHQGPLYGLLIGLKEIAASVEVIYLTGCDVPLLKPQFVQYLISQLGDSEIAVVRDERYFHPLAAVYRIELLDAVEKLIQSGERRPRSLFEAARTRIVSSEELRQVDPQLHSLRNMNKLDDYAELLKIAGISEPTGR